MGASATYLISGSLIMYLSQDRSTSWVGILTIVESGNTLASCHAPDVIMVEAMIRAAAICYAEENHLVDRKQWFITQLPCEIVQ